MKYYIILFKRIDNGLSLTRVVCLNHWRCRRHAPYSKIPLTPFLWSQDSETPQRRCTVDFHFSSQFPLFLWFPKIPSEGAPTRNPSERPSTVQTSGVNGNRARRHPGSHRQEGRGRGRNRGPGFCSSSGGTNVPSGGRPRWRRWRICPSTEHFVYLQGSSKVIFLLFIIHRCTCPRSYERYLDLSGRYYYY
jgi:hypothetical protein